MFYRVLNALFVPYISNLSHTFLPQKSFYEEINSASPVLQFVYPCLEYVSN
jgi:hypothetical protein